MFETLFGPIEKLINEHGSAAILSERIGLLKDKMELLAEENDRLKEQNRELKAEVNQLREANKKQSVPTEYLEHRGVLFRRLANGKIQDEVYCPDCKKPMSSLQRLTPYRCSICKFHAGFTGHELSKVLKEIESGESQ